MSGARNGGSPLDSVGLTSCSTRRSLMLASSASAMASSRARAPPAGRGSCRPRAILVACRRTPAGCRWPLFSLASRARAGVGERVARGAVDLRHAAQRVGVLHLAAVGGATRMISLPSSSARRLAAEAIWPGCGRTAWIARRRTARAMPFSASSDMRAGDVGEPAPAARARAAPARPMRGHELRAVDQRQPLLGLERERRQARRGASASAAGMRAGRRTRPRPRRSAPARGGPAAPDRPTRRPSPAPGPPDARRALSIATRQLDRLAGGRPRSAGGERVARSSSMAARAPRPGSGSPTPQAWLRSRFSCSRPVSSREMATSTNLPKPVLTPYVGVPESTARSISARAASIFSSACGPSPAVAPAIATRSTSSIERSPPVSRTSGTAA